MGLPANEVSIDNKGVVMINDTGIPDAEIRSAIAEQSPELAALTGWVSQTRRTGTDGLFQRDRYVTPDRIFDQMQTAQDAASSDDIVSGVLESTESLALSRMGMEVFDEDEENIWNQIASDLDLDSRLREMWRELFTVSQFYCVTWWGRKTYKVKGRDPKTGTKRKKVYENLRVPLTLSLLDPLKVVPVGNLMFNQESLVYSATRSEGTTIRDVLNNESDDEVIKQIMVAPWEPSRTERKLIGDMGIATSNLWLLNPENVWRHTATRPQYQRFADIRLKSIFELLDIKQQLREMDRATLLGATNFIVLVKIGTDEKPGKQAEIDRMQAQVRTLARVPVIVGDHRLDIEIITPDTDKTLEASRYGVLDGKIAARLYQTFITNGQSSKDDSVTLARIIARGMESRRHMLQRALEKNVITPTFDKNEKLVDEPSLQFHPTQIALDFDPGLATFLFDLRQSGEISRETILNQIDLDQDDEYRKRKREKESGYDDTFQTTVPFSSPGNNSFGGGAQNPGGPADNQGGGGGNPRSAGRTQGGNRNGGGAAPGSGQGQPARNPRRKSDGG